MGMTREPFYVRHFASKVSGSSVDEDEDDLDDDLDDDDDDVDEDAGKSDEELREELKRTRAALSKRTDESKRQLRRRREAERREAEARKPKPRKDGDGGEDAPDLDTVRHEARSEGEKAGLLRAKRAEAKAALAAAGVSPDRVQKAVGLLNLDDLDLDDEGLIGIDDAIDDLRESWAELFERKRTRRQSVAGDRDRDGSDRKREKPRTASQIAADRILGRG